MTFEVIFKSISESKTRTYTGHDGVERSYNYVTARVEPAATLATTSRSNDIFRIKSEILTTCSTRHNLKNSQFLVFSYHSLRAPRGVPLETALSSIVLASSILP